MFARLMSDINESRVRECLSTVKYPGFSRDIVSFGLVKAVEISGADVTVRLALATSDPNVPHLIKEGSEAALRDIPGIGQARILIDIQAPAQSPGAKAVTSIPGVKHIIAVASGKGGVGKSTVAANLAVALQQTGASTGLCDCDLYGPSIALMFGSSERPFANEQNQIIPIERYGVRLMSMGFLLDDGSPAILRGPMVTQYTQQFLRQVEWGELDYLLLDLPPGTGDIQLTIVQTVALAGAVVVTTPQEVALIDARKAASMFAKVNVPVLGIVENMSYFLCPSDGVRYDIFGKGGGASEAKRLGVPLLGEIPIDMATREAGDRGKPVVSAQASGPVADAFSHIAKTLRATIPV
jgi:ATP-binding protein involved in chromosome partitioning